MHQTPRRSSRLEHRLTQVNLRHRRGARRPVPRPAGVTDRAGASSQRVNAHPRRHHEDPGRRRHRCPRQAARPPAGRARPRGHRHDPQPHERRDSSRSSARRRWWPTRSTREAVARAVAEAEPEVIVHQLTALSGSLDLRHFDRDFALTNRLRTEGTDHLLAAGRAVGVQRFVAQSFAGWPVARTGGPVKTEDDPLDPTPPEADAHDPRRDPPPRGGRHRRRLDRGHRAALRRLLRSRARRSARRRRARRDDPQAQVPGGRRRRRRVVVHPHRGRRGGDGGRGRARRGAGSTTSSTTSRRPSPSGCRRSPRALGASRRGACRAGSAGCSPARPRPS